MASRISSSQIFQGSQKHVAQAREKEVATSEKASTQKAINRPSDDPRGWVIANRLKDDLSVQETFKKNAQIANHVISATENVIAQVQENVERAHELAVSTAGTAGSPQKRQLIKSEVEKLFQVTLQTLNTKFGPRTLMAGYKTDNVAFDNQGNFLGDEGRINIEIDRGVLSPVNISAPAAVLGAGIRDGVNIPEAFKAFIEGLDKNDTEAVNKSLEHFVKAIDQLSIARVELGSTQGNIEKTLQNLETNRVGMVETISGIEDVDATKVFSDLAREQTVMNAALNTTHKILTQTPVDALFR